MSAEAKREYDEALERMFRENNAKLPIDRQIAGNGIECCFHENDGFKCTLPIGHSGKHAAHGRLGYIVAQWENQEKPENLI